VLREKVGNNGFGYDPIFYLPTQGCTSAELAPEVKNTISHRAKALSFSVCCSCELKSQYGHFFTHQGQWIYSESGGSINKLLILLAVL
jgi:hypothetical protein